MAEETREGERKEQQVEETRANGGEIRTLCARELLGARGILRIEHEGEHYTLRLTRNNRLILTK